jgi:hypothetical protein
MNVLTAAQRLLVTVLVLGLSAVFLAQYHVGLPLAVLVSLFICIVLWLTRFLWMPPGFGATRVRLASLAGVFALAGTYGIWSALLDSAVNQALRSPSLLAAYPFLNSVHISSEPSLVVLGFVLLALLIVNYFMADKTISGQLASSIDKYFPEKDYLQKLQTFCITLADHLRRIDQETSWSPEYYVRLDAEVEVQSSTLSVSARKVTDLLSAVKGDKQSRTFLVLGDPGSGKSVALRKLAQEMLREVRHRERVPIYVNLREWLPAASQGGEHRWTEERRPSVKELTDFIIGNVKARGDLFTEEFVDTYFLKMWEHGRLFFILDSFDEIPQLLDVPEGSWLIDELGTVIWRVVAGNAESRGILASRFFRRPTATFDAAKTLELRPFSEEKIAQALERFPRFTAELQRQLFRDRADLMPIARNPFLMTLLGGWVEENGALPASHAAIYESHVRRRLARCAERMARWKLATDEVIQGAINIATFIFDSDEYGLEAPSMVIAGHYASRELLAVIDVLCYGRLGRQSGGDSATFAFVHRRFLEYFVAIRQAQSLDHVHLEDIPTDSRWRDALVLYAQLAEVDQARRLAAFCWSEVSRGFDVQDAPLRAIHSLRFLSDAFRGRRDAIESFLDELADFVSSGVADGRDLLTAKHSLEAAGLLTESRVEPILSTAIAQENEWLQETAFRSCRHIAKLSPQLEASLMDYVWHIPLPVIWRSQRSLLFSLSLSDGLRAVHKLVLLRLWEARIVCGTLLLLLLLFPWLIFVWGFLSGMVLAGHLWSWAGTGGTPKIIRSGLARMYGGLEALGDHLLLAARATPAVVIFFWLISMLLPLVRASEFPATSFMGTLVSWPWGFPVTLGTPLLFTASLLLVPWAALISKRLWLHMTGLGVLRILAFVASMVGVMWCVQYVTRLGDVVIWILGLVYVVVIAYVGYQIARRAVRSFRDWRELKRLPPVTSISRSDIKMMLGRFATNTYRRKFVRWLADRRIAPTGTWPAGFSLSDRSDPAITDLARLEERWLGLDR